MFFICLILMRVILIVVAYFIFENTHPSHAYILLNNFILSDFQKTHAWRTCTLLVVVEIEISFVIYIPFMLPVLASTK